MARLFNIKTRKRAAIGRRRISQLSAANAETSNETPPSAEYRVGYGRPPPWTQFKPKKSGNPKGRPKATSRKQGSIAQATLEKKTCHHEKRWSAQIAAAARVRAYR
jgi:Family of unknown function (DUF5681)